MVNKQLSFFSFIKVRQLLSIKKYLIIFFSIFLLPAVIIIFYLIYFGNKIYPSTRVANIPVGGLSVEQAENKLSLDIPYPESITIKGSGQLFTIPPLDINLSYDFEDSAHNAFNIYRTAPFKESFINRIAAPWNEVNLELTLNYDSDKLKNNLSVISEQLSNEPTRPSISLSGEGIVIQKGSPGANVDQDKLKDIISLNLSNANFDPISAPMITIDPSISDLESDIIKKRAKNLIKKSMTLTYEDYKYTISDSQIIDLIGFESISNEEEISKLVSLVADELNRKPQNPVFIFSDGKVKEFAPSKEGLTINEESLSINIRKEFESLVSSDNSTIKLTIPVTTTPADYETNEINNLGIKELLGRGTSKFRGSIPSRIHNISIASGHFNGTLVAPDENLSFNNIVGDVSKLTGYKEAYIIKDGKTVLGDGGGLCQVSTTLFRAALNSGLPITERRAHSYRVAYYEQDSLPGIDATVYAPTTDLKIKNNTSNHILIQTIVDTKTSSLVFEIYGTGDGRASTITKSVVYDVIPPPEDLYIDDPTLPLGTTKQIDWKAWGAKVKFNYKVTRGEELLYEKDFYSNYRPWQSVFLRGTAPVQ
jgi:vancomycin resistance protein YoaR